MILELDIGNTRIKWRSTPLRGAAVVSQGVFEELDQFKAMAAQQAKPEVFRFCSVREPQVADDVIAWSKQSWGLEPQLAEVARECGGVSINYPDVSRLGVDRWLALLAGYQRAGGACVIVDAGTAFTLDAIAADGNHLGGFILPGLNLMRQSLVENTGVRISAEAESRSIGLGNSTDEAVFNGSLASLVAVIEKYTSQLGEIAGQARLFISGGDAPLLADTVAFNNCEIVPGLVLDGLAIACPVQIESPSQELEK